MRKLIVAIALCTVVIALPAAQTPYYPPAGQWAHKAPAEAGMDAAKLNDAVDFMKAHETVSPPRDFSDQEIVFGKLLGSKAIPVDPIRTQVAAVSCGIHQSSAVLDLDYDEDSTAGSDGNFVLTADGAIVEAQLTAEGETFDEEGLLRLLRLARIGCSDIFAAQLKATGR